jgi:hypothetical protein
MLSDWFSAALQASRKRERYMPRTLMRTGTLQEAIKLQIEVNRFFASKKIKDLVGDYGKHLFLEVAGGTSMSATTKALKFNTQPTIVLK